MLRYAQHDKNHAVILNAVKNPQAMKKQNANNPLPKKE